MGGVSHYFTSPDEPLDLSHTHEIAMNLAGHEVSLLSAPGVFSGTRLDPGTAVLLELAPPPPPAPGPLLDLGCGYGPVALALALQHHDRQVWAVDVNTRALQLCAKNAQRLRLGTVHTSPPENLDPALRFAAIYSNPPIRIGKGQVHALWQRWLPHLAPGGVAYAVVSRHLGADSMHRWLVGQGWAVHRVGSRRGYRVLAITAL